MTTKPVDLKKSLHKFSLFQQKNNTVLCILFGIMHLKQNYLIIIIDNSPYGELLISSHKPLISLLSSVHLFTVLFSLGVYSLICHLMVPLYAFPCLTCPLQICLAFSRSSMVLSNSSSFYCSSL